VHAPQYHETLFSRIYPGRQNSAPTYIPLLEALEPCLGLTPLQKRRTVLRSDSGFGSDANVNYALKAQWQVLAKGKGGRRPASYARQLVPQDWHDLGQERWVAAVPDAPSYLCPTQHLLLRWRTEAGAIKHSTLVCSVMTWTAAEIVAYYDGRGACETEIRADKTGLKLERRRKKHLAAQEALILLTDIAHNLLAWTSQWMFASEPLSEFGSTRLTEDILSLPGRLLFQNQRLIEVQLNRLHPHASQVAAGLQRLLSFFGNP